VPLVEYIIQDLTYFSKNPSTVTAPQYTHTLSSSASGLLSKDYSHFTLHDTLKMHFLKAALAAVFATGAAAFTLPADLQNGVYRGYYDKDGREVHELVQAFEPGTVTLRRGTTDSKETSLDKRIPNPNTFYSCGCGFELDHGNCDNAVVGLKNYLNQNADPNFSSGCYDLVPYSTTYTYVNDVVVFLCNGAQDYGVCSNDVTNSLAAITNNCGWYIAGTEAAEAWYPELDGSLTVDPPYFTGYMQYSPGLNWCGNDWLAGTNGHC
jgi:hypothetical protein